MIFVVTKTSTAKCVRGSRNLINALFFWQGDPCLDTHQSELGRKHLPKEYQK